MKAYFISFLFCVSFYSCAQSPRTNSSDVDVVIQDTVLVVPDQPVDETVYLPVQKTSVELKLEALGLVNVLEKDSSILVDMKYATLDNFTKEILYDSLFLPYFLPDVADMVVKAQELLKAYNPDLSILIYDAARPISVQKKMHDLVKGTPQHIYVSNPANPGLHNYGTAVDLTLMNCVSGEVLDMGTPFDFFGKEAHIDQESLLVKNGKLTKEHVQNRKLLRDIMVAVGFQPLRSEWWHFNACTREEAKKKYKLIDF